MKQTLAQLLGQFKHREVRDLAWVIASPPLVSSNILTDNLNETQWWSNENCLSEFKDCLLELKKLDLKRITKSDVISTIRKIFKQEYQDNTWDAYAKNLIIWFM